MFSVMYCNIIEPLVIDYLIAHTTEIKKNKLVQVNNKKSMCLKDMFLGGKTSFLTICIREIAIITSMLPFVLDSPNTIRF